MHKQFQLMVLTLLVIDYIYMKDVEQKLDVIEQKTEPVFVYGQAKVILSCSIKLSNETPLAPYNVIWLKGDVPLSDLKDNYRFSFSGNDTLVIDRPTYDDAGVYVARFQNKEDFPNYYNCSVRFIAKPLVKKFKRDLNLAVGDNMNLHCIVKGFPILVTWYKDNIDLSSIINSTRISMMPLNGINNTHLHITNLKKTDSGTYTCQAQSTFLNSTSSESIEIRVTEFLAALWPFMGITGEVLVLCVIVFLCERHDKIKNKRRLYQQSGRVPIKKRRHRKKPEPTKVSEKIP